MQPQVGFGGLSERENRAVGQIVAFEQRAAHRLGFVAGEAFHHLRAQVGPPGQGRAHVTVGVGFGAGQPRGRHRPGLQRRRAHQRLGAGREPLAHVAGQIDAAGQRRQHVGVTARRQGKQAVERQIQPPRHVRPDQAVRVAHQRAQQVAGQVGAQGDGLAHVVVVVPGELAQQGFRQVRALRHRLAHLPPGVLRERRDPLGREVRPGRQRRTHPVVLVPQRRVHHPGGRVGQGQQRRDPLGRKPQQQAGAGEPQQRQARIAQHFTRKLRGEQAQHFGGGVGVAGDPGADLGTGVRREAAEHVCRGAGRGRRLQRPGAAQCGERAGVEFGKRHGEEDRATPPK